MSHIRKTKEELKHIKKYILELDKTPYDKDLIEEILKYLSPKDNLGKNMVSINTDSRLVATPAYIPKSNIVLIPDKSFEKIIAKSVDVIKTDDIKDDSLLTAYYIMYSLMHEMEHAYEFLIAKDKIPYDIKEVKTGYKDIITTIYPKDRLIQNPVSIIRAMIAFYKYNKDPYGLVIERNATVEALNELLILSEEDKEINNILNDLYYAFLSIGYYDTNKGNMYETYERLKILDKYRKYQKESMLDENEKIRFGLTISDEGLVKLNKKVKTRF